MVVLVSQQQLYSFVNSSGINTGAPNAANTAASAEIVTAVDWYDQQTLGLENSTVFWKSLAPRPTTNKVCLR